MSTSDRMTAPAEIEVTNLPKGCVFNVQRYSTTDGPGIRTTVFFKGCNLRCVWCHNPESYSPKPELEFNRDLCIGCERCVEVCPRHVHAAGGGQAAHRENCVACGRCVDQCYAGALTLAGTMMDEDQIMREILTDVPYYRQSGGGVTFSGGECMLQIDALEAVLRLCREAGVHTAVDTAGNVPWAAFERILPYTDLFLYDMKAYDPDVHKRLTGVDNRRILENLDRLFEAGADVWVRVPCVPGANDGELGHIAQWLEGKPVRRVDLLAYHRLGGGKRALLGIKGGVDFDVPDAQVMDRYLQPFLICGLPAKHNA